MLPAFLKFVENQANDKMHNAFMKYSALLSHTPSCSLIPKGKKKKKIEPEHACKSIQQVRENTGGRETC